MKTFTRTKVCLKRLKNYNFARQAMIEGFGRECKENERLCGSILSLDSKFCIPKEVPCPITKITFDKEEFE